MKCLKDRCLSLTCILTLAAGPVLTIARGQEPTATPAATPAPSPALVPDAITFMPLSASAPISAAVAIPAGQALLFTSGTAPSVVDENAPAGSRERYGDTKTQGLGVLRAIEARLQKAGLGLKDVIYLRVYIAPDEAKGGHFDYPGWFEAYAQFFGTAANPVKPARSTVGVASLVEPGWLIEIEAVAAYPKGSTAPAK
jgi:enamine deaminase RidA (YjgF/YER057c/UK114 family)